MVFVSLSGCFFFGANMLTSEKSAQNAAETIQRTHNMTMWKEVEFEEKCTYIVMDQPVEEDLENQNARSRAERSLPRNLSLKRNSTEVRNKIVMTCLITPTLCFKVYHFHTSPQ